MPERGSNKTADLERHSKNLSLSIQRIFWTSIVVVIAISILDIAGWITSTGWLKSLEPLWIPMKSFGALCFTLTSLALVVIYTRQPSVIKRTGPIGSGIFLIIGSSLTIVSWLYDIETGDQALLSVEPVLKSFLSQANRIPLMSALMFFFIGIILILLTSDRLVAGNIAHIACFLVSVIAYMIPASYILRVYSVSEIHYAPVSLNSGIAFCFVCAAVFMARSDTWLMRVFTGNNLGGVMARRIFPWLLLLPVFIGWLRIFGVQSGIYSPDVGVLLIEIAYTFCFILIVWFTGRSISLIDKKRQAADAALKSSYEEMETRVRERTSDLLNLNKALDQEIKERIRAEELVESERQRMNGLLEIMPAYLILLTPDYHVSYANRFFRERFGESNGKRCYEFLFDRSEPCEICDTFKVLKDNSPHTWEWTGPDARKYSIYDFPYSDSDGSPLIMEMGIDITSLKEAEAKLVSLNTRLEQIVSERTAELLAANKRLDILSRTSSRLLASDNPQDLINSLCINVMEFLDCQVFFNFLSDDTKGKLHLNAFAGIPEKSARRIEWLDYGEAVCGCVAREGVRLVAENIPETTDPRTDMVKSFGIKAYACHPLLSHDKVIGTLSFGTSTRTSFNEDDLSLMKTVADQVAIAMTRVRDAVLLRRSEERYRSLMELSPGASFVNRNNAIVMLNSAARMLLGARSSEEILGKSLVDIFHHDSHALVKQRLDKIMKGESVPISEEQIVRSDGAVRDVEVVAARITDSDGPAIQLIMSDITERKLADKELFDTKNYLQNLIDYANAPIIVWDKENKIRLFNHAFEHLTGYSASEVEGRNLDLLFPWGSLKESKTKIKQALTENWVTIEIPILTKSKQIRTVLWNSAKVYDKNKKTFSTIAQGNDITERVEAERAFKASRQKLEMALENGKIGTWEWEIGTNRLRFDERMERMFGKEPGTFEYTFNTFEKSIHEEDLPHVRYAFNRAVNENIPVDTVFRVKNNNNEVNYISTKALVEKDSNRNPYRISGVCFDITEMKKGAEKVLFELNENLLRSNRDLEQFAYVASHDLQEPLRMVSSFTQLLHQRYKDKLDQDANDFIQFAVEGATRMQALINDLLDYSRIQTRGRKFVPIDMHDVIGQVINNLMINIQEKNALVTNDELPRVVADEGQMVQLFQNLIMNGIKFCKTSPRIHISVKEGNDHFLFSVKDNGIGIESQYFTKIFQIFQRLHPKDEYGGTGIGLAICKRIIDRHGGRIWVESKPGKGSVFLFTILKRQIIPNNEKFSYQID